jgi:hypothetical protein
MFVNDTDAEPLKVPRIGGFRGPGFVSFTEIFGIEL